MVNRHLKTGIFIIALLSFTHSANALKSTVSKLEPDSIVYNFTDTMPAFPGGNKALIQYINNTLHYNPKGNPFTGNSVIEFIVEKNGTVSNARVVKKLSTYCDEEALRVIRSMNNWQPGIKNGKPVRVKMVIPVVFRIQ